MMMIAYYVNCIHTIEPFKGERKRDGQTVFMLICPHIYTILTLMYVYSELAARSYERGMYCAGDICF